MYRWGLGYTNGYIPTKKKGIRKGRKIIEEEPGLTVSIYGEVYDFCQGITHSRLTHLLASKSKLERCMVWSHFSCVWSCSETLRWRVVCKSEYSCYFIIVVMSYVVRNTSCWNQAGATKRMHSHLKIVFHSCNHPKELLAEDRSASYLVAGLFYWTASIMDRVVLCSYYNRHPGHRAAFPASSISAKTTICGFTECLIHRHGIPHNIVSDQGVHFTANEVRQRSFTGITIFSIILKQKAW